MKSFVGKVNATLLFLSLQAVLYVAFLTLDLNGGHLQLSNRIKFTIIILCFCYVYFYAGKGIIFLYGAVYERRLLRLLQFALLFTLISDLFILVLDYYLYGVLTFILTQQLYAVRLDLLRVNEESSNAHVPLVYNQSSNRVSKMIITRVSFQLILAGMVYLLLAFTGVALDTLLIATVFYFISIVTNVVNAIIIAYQHKKVKSNMLFAAGMCLFLLCDINVGLFNLADFISLPEQFYQPIYAAATILMWTFYAPSQVLIALSARRSSRSL